MNSFLGHSRRDERKRRTRVKKKQWPTLIRQFNLEYVESRILLAVTWDGGGDGKSWGDRFNWDGDAIPASNDDVIIDDLTQDLLIEITSDAFANTVNSLEHLTISEAILTSGSLSTSDLRLGSSGGITAPAGQVLTLDVNGVFTVSQGADQLVINGPATVSGSLRMEPSTALIADGSLASFQADGPTKVHGADLIAQDGGQIRLPFATNYVHSSSTNYETRSLIADGAGSRLELSGLTPLPSALPTRDREAPAGQRWRLSVRRTGWSDG